MQKIQRYQIKNKINSKLAKIKKLESEIRLLKVQALQISDRRYKYTETYEDILISKKPAKSEKRLIGCVKWKEKFEDFDTGKIITIERNTTVRMNDEFFLPDFLFK